MVSALNSGDVAWVLTSTTLVLLMTLPGLALFYGGLVRSKNVLSILMQCLISAGLMGVLWVVVGYSLLITLGTKAPLGAWLLEHLGIRFVFSWTGAALAAAIVTFPFQVRAIRLALEAIDPGLSDAAETLGAGPVDRFASITLPLALPGIIAGAITAFAASLGEFGAIITFGSNILGETRTPPLEIYTAIQTPGGEAAAARLAGLSITLALAGLVIWWRRRQL